MRQVLMVSAFAMLWLGGSGSVFAGKGVKKAGRPHEIHGVVTHVHHDAGKPGHGEFTVTSPASKKKGVPAGQGVQAAKHQHHFKVSPSTQFFHHHNGQTTAAAFGALRTGEHVAVLAKDHHAEKVTIQTHSVKKKAVKGKKAKGKKVPAKKPRKK